MMMITTNHVLEKKINAAKRLKSQTSDNYPSKNQPQQIRDFSTQVSTYENPSFVSNLSHPSGEFSKNVQYMNLHTIVYTHLICDHDSNIHANFYSRTLGIGLENTQHWTPKVPPHVVFTSVPSPLKDKMDKRQSIPAILPLRYYKIENRLSY